MDTQALRKARGAFFTPERLSRFVCDWAIRSASDIVLEPSCGEAAFLLSSAERLRALGGPETGDQLRGAEIHAASAEAAASALAQKGHTAQIFTGDFFQLAGLGGCDVVVGNPPYVRYQQFTGAARARALEAALAQGVRLNGLASSWAAFTVHAATFLKPEGRLGLVLPAELLTVNYAAEVRRFLLERFASVRLVIFEELVFPGVLEEVVLLLAEGAGGAPCFEVYQARNLDDLGRVPVDAWTNFAPKGSGKWSPALLPSAALRIYERLVSDPRWSSLSDWGATYLGAVTGANSFFSLTEADVDRWSLSPADLRPISPPGGRHLKDLAFRKNDWDALRRAGKAAWLFDPKAPLSPAAIAYIAEGARTGVSKGYKCSKRAPWWTVPTVDAPDLIFTYMNQDWPRLIANEAGVDILNSVYGVRLKPSAAPLGRELLPIAYLNSLSILGAEIVGRAYGGGLLKHEPREADQIPLPTFFSLSEVQEELRAIGPAVQGHLRVGDAPAAIDLVDRVLLRTQMGVSPAELGSLRAARQSLFQRRLTRSRT